MASIVLRRVSTRASIWYATTRSDNGLDMSLGVATPATGAADCILAAEEMHRLAIIRTNSRAEQRSMFLSLKRILPDTVHNESLLNCEAYTGAASLGRFGAPLRCTRGTRCRIFPLGLSLPDGHAGSGLELIPLAQSTAWATAERESIRESLPCRTRKLDCELWNKGLRD